MSSSRDGRPWNARSLRSAVRELIAADPLLAESVDRFGPPPIWAREPDFATLVHLILEQQVSLASARAAFDRLSRELAVVEPERFLSLDDGRLRAIGFSRQKAGYGRDLAIAFLDGFDLESLANEPDEHVRARLMGLRGIGRWTADVYLIMCLLRPDVWPHGDQALSTAIMDINGLRSRPTWSQTAEMADSWRPYRSVAARILWHHYLRVRGLPV
jgi:DNA-3-methyladenine glycosylase II